ncbi:MAG: threonine/serine exporter [Clostridium sp.]|nr:threonine/serine exporter [Clostridium sp.]
MFIEIISAFFVSLSFGFLFNIKGKYLYLAGIGGAIGWFAYKISLYFNCSESVSMFICAIFFSCYCEICARKFHTPVTILSVCALIPVVPGYGVYKSMYAFLVGDYINAIDYSTSTLYNAGALALGVILVATFFKFLKKFIKVKE